ncbi:NADP-dependent phosphogluconate dehydrogenase [Gloeobacter violaceus]|uniref:6-phosphogluconate dehydrogenase, decarboxylating n=1 Tax=Gloeobacter violaceus (strain ATCC 29082 / PCC 7421) TaxID=251221 RepID=Q7NLK6_GLOVI|nr:NADP-dependent phosphogluconate dehydrogenase [Gloeobacter violaceus]BAC89058.1 6-phosphogluconate dehydrogenase [Gloeobacter violaceus PCC 7421]
METSALQSGAQATHEKPSIGLIGLAVMGENLALNIANHGFPISVYNRTAAKTQELAEGRARGKALYPTFTMEEFVASMERPRKIIILVKAGAPVDAVIDQLKPLLEKDDVIIDGGNSLFTDTEKRSGEIEALGLRFVGMGVSGGEEGALKGPSLMPGGPKTAYDDLAPILTQIAAQVDDGPCVTYIGPRGAGHYVKMVHNGIEYGDMQLIAEAYDLLRQTLGLGAAELHDIFAEWNAGELKSFLIEITADIFTKIDPETGKPLVDLILDKAGQKGTGKWTSQNAYDLGIPIPTINAAVESRILSAYKSERVAASKILSGPERPPFTGEKKQFIDAVRDALYCAKICSYAQGMALLKAASHEYDYHLNLSELARIWKGGCIIRAIFLDKIKNAFLRDPALTNLLIDSEFSGDIQARQANWRYAVQTAAQLGIPAYATGASLAYYDAYRTAQLPLNLTQAQRDYFGAHTYERIDKEGVFHTEWFS